MSFILTPLNLKIRSIFPTRFYYPCKPLTNTGKLADNTLLVNTARNHPRHHCCYQVYLCMCLSIQTHGAANTNFSLGKRTIFMFGKTTRIPLKFMLTGPRHHMQWVKIIKQYSNHCVCITILLFAVIRLLLFLKYFKIFRTSPHLCKA